MTTTLKLELGIDLSGNTIVEISLSGDNKQPIRLPEIMGYPGSFQSAFIGNFYQTILKQISLGWGVTAANQINEWGNDGNTPSS